MIPRHSVKRPLMTGSTPITTRHREMEATLIQKNQTVGLLKGGRESVEELRLQFLTVFSGDQRFFMGDLVAAKDAVNRFRTDLQPCGGFQQVCMLLQGCVSVGLELRKQLLLVAGRHRAVTARRLGNNVQGVLAVTFQIIFDGIDMHREIFRRFVRRSTLQYQGDNPSPKLQALSTDPHRIHAAIMSNALGCTT